MVRWLTLFTLLNYPLPLTVGSFNNSGAGHDPRGLNAMGSPPNSPLALAPAPSRAPRSGSVRKTISATAILLDQRLSRERSVLTRAVANRASGANRSRSWKEEGTPFLRRKRLVYARRHPFPAGTAFGWV